MTLPAQSFEKCVECGRPHYGETTYETDLIVNGKQAYAYYLCRGRLPVYLTVETPTTLNTEVIVEVSEVATPEAEQIVEVTPEVMTPDVDEAPKADAPRSNRRGGSGR